MDDGWLPPGGVDQAGRARFDDRRVDQVAVFHHRQCASDIFARRLC